MGDKIRVLVVDDSALVRQMLSEMLESDAEIEVVGSASDPYVARNKIKRLNPDVLTLDVEMPRMDGLTFLQNLMRLRPMPVVMVSSLTEKGADTTLRALEIGAIDFVAKPKIDLANTFKKYTDEILSKVKMAAKAQVRVLEQYSNSGVSPREIATRPAASSAHFRTTDRIIALGASTGGTEAIKSVLARLPADMPGIVIALHIPEAFSGTYAKRLNSLSAMTVAEAEDGAQILRGHVYIARGDTHLEVVRDGARYICKVTKNPPVNRHRPSVDVLFNSVAQNVGQNAMGVLLTGMGEDGARGLKVMRDSGAHTLAQDEATSVVWGMPGTAVRMDAAIEVLALERFAGRLQELLQ